MTHSGVEATIEIVTPERAEEWLGKNVHNRVTRDRVVAAYARDMVAGRWKLTGEAIKFSLKGVLLDGQHRLQAVIRSGQMVPMLVVRGLEGESQEVMDSGAGRTAGDALRLRGRAQYSALAAAARAALLLETSGQLDGGNQSKVTHSEILDFLDENKDLIPAVEMAASYCKAIDVPLSVLSIACWRLSRVDMHDSNLFFAKLAEKTLLSNNDPILALINRLTDIRRNNRRLDRAGYLSLIYRAWNYWRARKTVANLPIITRGGASVDIPEPK